MNIEEILKRFTEELRKCNYKVEVEFDEQIIISMNGFFRPLGDILSMYLAYPPFCKYKKNGIVFVEWKRNCWGIDMMKSVLTLQL